MNSIDRKFLSENLTKLSENCNFFNLVGFLKEKKVFTDRQIEHYESEQFQILGEEQKCQQLFTDIQTRGPKAFAFLQECFEITGHKTQHHLLSRRRVDVSEPLIEEGKQKVILSKHLIEGPDVYEMSSYPRGAFIFINNIKFDILETREGAIHDADFQDCLEGMGYKGYKGGYFANQTTQEMRRLLQEFAVDESLSKVDSCMVIIASHGSVTDSKELVIEGTVFDKSNPLLCDEIINLLNSNTCKLRPGCPKIFIFQACRGHGYIFQEKLLDLSDVRRTPKPWVDTFLLAPCIEGLMANRYIMFGTWLILALKDVFQKYAHSVDLGSMKNLITDKFDEYFKDSDPRLDQTLAYYEYGVSKKLFFNPGVRKPEID